MTKTKTQSGPNRRDGTSDPGAETPRNINRRRILTLGVGTAAASVAVPLLTRSTEAGATTLSTEKAVTTLTPNQTLVTFPSDTADQVNFSTNAALGGTLTVLSPSGTPTDGQVLSFRITSTSAQTYSWSTIFHSSPHGALPPVTSGANLTDYFLFTWRGAANCWDLVAYVAGFS